MLHLSNAKNIIQPTTSVDTHMAPHKSPHVL